MHCTNCGQELAEGTTLCPSCGAPQTPAPTITVSPAAFTPPAAAPTLPGSSGLSTASLILGLLGILLLVAVYVFYVVQLLPLVTGSGGALSPDDLVGQLNTSNLMGIGALYILAIVLALVGLILGIVGVSMEGKQPTRHGKALGIVGIVLGSIPLLCCVTSILLSIVSLTGGS